MKHKNAEKTPPVLEGQLAPKTSGQTISWASLYDALVWLLSLGKGSAFRKTTIELSQIKPGDSVLDVGCGTGDLTIAAKAVAGHNGEVYGTDAAPGMIAAAQRKVSQAGVDVTIQVGLIENITFPDNQFDVVLNSLMMHHLPDDLKRDGLTEIFRVLKPEGRLLIIDIESSRQSWMQGLSNLVVQLHGGHKRMRNNVKKLAPMMEAAGFTEVTAEVIDRQFSFITGKKAHGTV